MKTFTILCLLIVAKSFGQEKVTYFRQGQSLLGGNLKMSTQINHQLGFRFSNFTWNSSLSGHQFISDRQTAGMMIDFDGLMLDASGVDRFYSLGFGLASRRYFGRPDNDLNVFAEINTSLGTRFSGAFVRQDYYQFQCFGGPSYFITNHWNIEARLGWTARRQSQTWIHSIPFQFGLHYFF